MNRRTTNRLLILTVVLLAGVILLPRYTEVRLSCQRCRALRRVGESSILGIDLSTSLPPDETSNTAAQSACAHDWWQYSMYEQQGIFGLVYKKVACDPSQYRDGWRPGE